MIGDLIPAVGPLLPGPLMQHLKPPEALDNPAKPQSTLSKGPVLHTSYVLSSWIRWQVRICRAGFCGPPLTERQASVSPPLQAEQAFGHNYQSN
jgi:hypothetical protein